MTFWLRTLTVVVGTISASVLTFWTWLRVFPPSWQSSEYAAIAAWSIPLAAVVLTLSHFPRRWLLHRHAVIRIAVAPVIGIVSAIAWTFVAYPMSGGQLEYFDVHPTLCWLVAGTVGAMIALLWHGPRPVAAVAGAT